MNDVFKTVRKIRLCEYDTTAMVILEHRDEKMRADERERCKAAMRKVVELNVQWTFTDLLNAIDIAEAIKAE